MEQFDDKYTLEGSKFPREKLLHCGLLNRLFGLSDPIRRTPVVLFSHGLSGHSFGTITTQVENLSKLGTEQVN